MEIERASQPNQHRYKFSLDDELDTLGSLSSAKVSK